MNYYCSHIPTFKPMIYNLFDSFGGLSKLRRVLLLIVLFTTVQSVFAQLPADIKNVKVDELTDAQIKQYILESEKSGIPEAQQESLALKNGMPPSELQKLRDRVAKIRSTPGSAAVPVTPQEAATQATPKENAPVINNAAAPAPTVEVVSSLDPNAIYGHHIFRNNNLQFFERASDVKAPDNYVIGPNDELVVSVFGFSYFNEVLKVDSRGAINPTSIGPIMLKGLEFSKAKTLIRTKFSQFFDLSNNQLTVTLSYSRVINVNFVGEVMKPGSYKIPALNTAFNALIAVGGPSDLGSVRNIQVKRNGKLVKTLDVYEYLNNPNSTMDYYLQDNDYIYINPSVKVVKITGEVKRSMKYELKPQENLDQLIAYAGGLTPLAYTKLIRISRSNEDGTQQQLLNISLDSLIANKKSFPLKDGDQIEISSKSNELRQFVEVQGSVNMPGKFEFREGERISDVIKKANGTRFESLLERAYLIRLRPDLSKEYISVNIKDAVANPGSASDLLLQKGDMIRIASNKDFTDSQNVEAIGAFRTPRSLTFSEGMTLGDLLFLSGGLRMEADILNIEISRISFFTDEFKPGESSRTIIKVVQVGKDIKITDDQLSFKLRPFDQIFARIVPDFEYQQNFTISGEVKYPGTYSLEAKDEKLSAIIKRAGGLNRFAFPEGATLYRPDLRGNYIVMNLKDALKSERSRFNYIIKAGDVVNIPKVIDFIAIRGDVEYLTVIDQDQVNSPFVQGRRANYYIKEFANGFTKTSFKRKTYVVDNNAKVNRTKNFIFFKIYPKVRKGSTVYVVNKPVKEKDVKKQSEPVNWTTVIERTTVKITGLITLYLLLRTVSN